MSAKVLVTGGTGFIGSHLVEELVEQGFKVEALVRNDSKADRLKELGVEIIYGSLTENFYIPPKIDFVIHAAGVTKAVVLNDYAKNIRMTQSLMGKLKNREIKRFLYLSSQAAAGPGHREGNPRTEDDYPKPLTHYGQSKLIAEEVIQNCNIPYTILRAPTVYGPGDKDFFRIFKMVRDGLVLEVGRGVQKLSMIYVKNLVAGIVYILQHEKAKNQTFFITDDEDYTSSQIYSTLGKIMNRRYLLLKVPFKMAWLMALAAERYAQLIKRPSIINCQKVREFTHKNWLCSQEKIRQLIGWRSRIDLHSALQETLHWYKEKGWI